MTPRRAAAYAVLGAASGAAVTLGAGLAITVADWQRAQTRARRTAHAYGRTTK